MNQVSSRPSNTVGYVFPGAVPREMRGGHGWCVWTHPTSTPTGYHGLARAKVLDGHCLVMPVLANGRVCAKTNKGQMVCVDVSGPRMVNELWSIFRTSANLRVLCGCLLTLEHFV